MPLSLPSGPRPKWPPPGSSPASSPIPAILNASLLTQASCPLVYQTKIGWSVEIEFEFGPREIAALQKVVEIGTDDPLPLRRARRLPPEMRDEFFASWIFGVADVVEQFEDQRSQNRVVVRIDQARQQRAPGKFDHLRVARLEARKRAFVADGKHLAVLDRDRRGDWRARPRADRAAAQNEVGASVRCEGRRGPDCGQRRGRADRVGHESAPGGHARHPAQQAGHPAGMELIAEKELIETPATHREASQTRRRATAPPSNGPIWIAK